MQGKYRSLTYGRGSEQSEQRPSEGVGTVTVSTENVQSKTRKIVRFGENQQFPVAATLRRAVKHVRLAAHQKRSRATPPD